MLNVDTIGGRQRVPFGRLSGAQVASNGREYGYEAFWTYYGGVVMWDARVFLNQVPLATFDGTLYLESGETPEALIPQNVAAAIERWLRRSH
jgi:hypothetical protein